MFSAAVDQPWLKYLYTLRSKFLFYTRNHDLPSTRVIFLQDLCKFLAAKHFIDYTKNKTLKHLYNIFFILHVTTVYALNFEALLLRRQLGLRVTDSSSK